MRCSRELALREMREAVVLPRAGESNQRQNQWGAVLRQGEPTASAQTLVTSMVAWGIGGLEITSLFCRGTLKRAYQFSSFLVWTEYSL